MNDVKKTLEYFYKLEFLNPYEPTGIKMYDSRINEKSIFPIRFRKSSEKEKTKIVYSIYIGTFDYQNSLASLEYMIHKIPSFYQKGKTTSIICGFKIDEEGMVLPDSFSIASFVYAIYEMIKKQQIDVPFDLIEMGKLKRKIIEEIKFGLFEELTSDFLEKIYESLVNVFECIANDFSYDVVVLKETVRKRKNKEEECSPAILPSFYLEDIITLLEYPNDSVFQFLSLQNHERIEIEKDVDTLKRLMNPNMHPYGRWPSKNHISFMQEVSIHLSLRGKSNIFSVNGPPGSGKTTLIKEIVASNIVERAIFMTKFSTPDEAFQKKKWKGKTGHYFRLHETLTRQGMLIASNNNFAVENITLELPNAKALKEENTLTNLFDIEKTSEIYFTDLIRTLSKKSSWGFISVRLGKKANIQEFLNAIWYNKQERTLKDYFQEKKHDDFAIKKKRFLEKFKEVRQERMNLLQVEEDIEKLETIQNKMKNFKNKKQEEYQILKVQEEALLKKKKNYLSKGIILGDNEFYKNIETNKTSQLLTPWISEKYNRLREELFYEALQLHKSFILNSKRFQKNMELFIDFLSNRELQKRKESYTDVLNTVFLFVPVISTTLASVSRFLGDIQENSIGYVIIDEAGQATPASALGLLMRSKKTIFLGDPYQIEPVAPTPMELYDIIDYKKEINLKFHNPFYSAQYFADFSNPFGAKRGSDWIGTPLLLHRRCESPMFEISNEIAYDKKMISCTIEKESAKPLLISTSSWIDVEGKEVSKENHYVKEEGEVLLNILEKYLIENAGILPNLFIISPFKTVAAELRKKVMERILKVTLYQKEEIESWVLKNIGTIHTFQGKETDEVIIVLGCSKESIGAVKWATEKPNILNVAVSRAKKRLLIIGNKALWEDMPYFNVVEKYLK